MTNNEEPQKQPVEFDPEFKHKLSKIHGAEKLMRCFQCGTCTSDCPIARFSDDYRPRQLIRMSQFGMKDKVLKSDALWLCASCFTCTDRCPQDVKVADIIRVLRNLAAEEGQIPLIFQAEFASILESGYAYKIPDFRIKKRGSSELPPLPKCNSEAVQKLLSGINILDQKKVESITFENSCAKKNKKYLLFLGCAIPGRVTAYEMSARKVLEKLCIEIVEMPEFNCCGLPLDPVNHEAMLLLAAHNLAIAEREGLNILTLCPGCASTLKKVNKTLKEDKELRNKINRKLKETGLVFKGRIEAKHLTQVLIEDVGLDKIKASVTKPLMNAKVAEHNGCHVLRPESFNGFDDPENPKALKSLIEATGATCLDYLDETECCGAPSVGINDKVALQLARDKLKNVKAVDAQALITICPFCYLMYDTNQRRIEKTFNEEYGIPILHYPQLLGLALGIPPDELAFTEMLDNLGQRAIERAIKTLLLIGQA